MNLKRIFLFVFLIVIPFSCYANANSAKKEICYICKADLILASGVSFSRLSNQSNFAVNSFVTNNYDANKTLQGRLLAGIGIGHTFEHIYNRPYNLSLNLMGYYFNLGRIFGVERPFVNGGTFDTLNYRFHAESYSLFLEPHLIYTCYDWQPYLLAGVGVTRNALYDYHEIPTNPAASAAPVPVTFQRETITQFAYEAGFGVQRSIYKNAAYHLQLALSMDYRYIYLGKGKLGTFPAQTNSNRLQISPLSTQAIIVAVTARYFDC